MRLENIYIASEVNKEVTEGLRMRETIPDPMAVHILYELLEERTDDQNISHQAMPTYEEHEAFVLSDPYKAWYLIEVPVFYEAENGGELNQVVGAIYLTHNNEIGIQLFQQYTGNGYGERAIENLMSMFDGPFYANINPKNKTSIHFFTKLGFKHIQQTYKREVNHEKTTDTITDDYQLTH